MPWCPIHTLIAGVKAGTMGPAVVYATAFYGGPACCVAWFTCGGGGAICIWLFGWVTCWQYICGYGYCANHGCGYGGMGGGADCDMLFTISLRVVSSVCCAEIVDDVSLEIVLIFGTELSTVPSSCRTRLLWSSCFNSVRISWTTLALKFVWYYCRPVVSHNCCCVSGKWILKFVYVFWTWVLLFHLRIQHMNSPVLLMMPYAIFMICGCEYGLSAATT